MELRQEMIERFMNSYLAEQEKVLRDIFDKLFGVNGWSLASLKNHCELFSEGGRETLIVDGTPVVEFYPSVMGTTDDGPSVLMYAKRHYRMLV